MSSKAFRVGGKGMCEKDEEKAIKKRKQWVSKETHVPTKG
jgi:hypothetical protein